MNHLLNKTAPNPKLVKTIDAINNDLKEKLSRIGKMDILDADKSFLAFQAKNQANYRILEAIRATDQEGEKSCRIY